MSRVTMRIDMIKTPILITDDDCELGTFQANANGYEPFRFQAESIGAAVDTVIMQCSNFRKTAERKVKSEIRSQQAKKRWADLKASQVPGKAAPAMQSPNVPAAKTAPKA